MKKYLGILVLLALLALFLGACSKNATTGQVMVQTEPLDSADAIDVQPDPNADLGNESISSTSNDLTSDKPVFEDPV